MRHCYRLAATLIAGLGGSATALCAQAVPSLGAEALIGTAGITALSPWGTPGAGANPAEFGCCARWSLGLALLTAPSTDASEQAFGGAVRAGRLGFGLRLATRRVTHLFDDPVLDDADLRVEDTGASLGAAVALGGGLRAGASALYTNSTVLGASAEGFGGRVGLEFTDPDWSLGAYYGTLEPAATWHIGGSTSEDTTPGTRRLAVAGSVNTSAVWQGLPRVTVELDSDHGDRPGQWLRANLGWSFFDAQLQILGGTAREIGSASLPSTHEAAVGVNISRILIYLGSGFGAEPAPGNTYVVGVVFAN